MIWKIEEALQQNCHKCHKKGHIPLVQRKEQKKKTEEEKKNSKIKVFLENVCKLI